MFGEEQYFVDAQAFWTLQDEAIQAKREQYLAHGWPQVEMMERGQRFYQWEYQKAGKKKGGAVWIAVSERGEVEVHEGYQSREEARKREKKQASAADKPKSAKPELTAPMQNNVELHRLAAIRLELLNHSQVALRLVLAHLIVGSSLWNVRPEPMKAAKSEIGASVAANPATVLFNERRSGLLQLLGFEEDRDALVRPNGDSHTLASIFVRLLKLPEEDVLRLLALAMAETLAAGTVTAELVGAVTQATLNDWRPDECFFDLLGGRETVNAMLADLGSPAVAESNKDAPAKVQKGIIKDFMHGSNGREHKADWLPPYFRFPPTGYRADSGISVVEHGQLVAQLLTPAIN